MSFILSDSPLDPAALAEGLRDRRAGALATFEGWVRLRNEGREVSLLEYEAYPALAQSEGEAVVREARERFALLDARCSHRVGRLGLGDLAVWVGVTAEHRGPAFEACRYIIDELKARLPIWKKELYVQGESAWINCATRGEHAGAKKA